MLVAKSVLLLVLGMDQDRDMVVPQSAQLVAASWLI